MSRYTTISVLAEINLDDVLNEIEEEDLIEEIEARGYVVSKDSPDEPLTTEDFKWMKWLILNHCDLLKDMQARDVYDKLRAAT